MMWAAIVSGVLLGSGIGLAADTWTKKIGGLMIVLGALVFFAAVLGPR